MSRVRDRSITSGVHTRQGRREANEVVQSDVSDADLERSERPVDSATIGALSSVAAINELVTTTARQTEAFLEALAHEGEPGVRLVRDREDLVVVRVL